MTDLICCTEIKRGSGKRTLTDVEGFIIDLAKHRYHDSHSRFPNIIMCGDRNAIHCAAEQKHKLP